MRRALIHMTVILSLGVILACGGGGGSGGGGDEEKPVLIRGSVVDLADGTAVEGALIQAVDVNGASLSTSATSAADGSFTLTVPATRDGDGVPVAGSYSLRVQAAGYLEFPTAIRPALPVDVSSASLADDGWVITSSLTTVGLVALEGDTSVLGSISGTVQAGAGAGVLVVAEGAGEAHVGYSDSDGRYTIFNVPAGSYAVRAYASGLQVEPVNATVVAAEAVTGVDLLPSDAPLSTVSGSVQIVNASGEAVTSIVLAVESTFQAAAGRGAVPPGLRVEGVTSAFTLDDVPDGRYVVLAAFENDDLVRDPDQSIGGTATVVIAVPDATTGNTVAISEGFKVTGALAVVGPGADGPEAITMATPTFEWADDSSEDGYEVHVFDSLGNEVWSDEIGSVSGSATVTDVYGGPALEEGMFYQFRATSFRDDVSGRTAISTTEDLKGVFYLSTAP
jgi:hypothetical protein